MNQSNKSNRQARSFLVLIGITSLRPRGRFRRWLNRIGAALGMVLILLILYEFMTPYEAKDYNYALTLKAKSALSIIKAISSYQHDKRTFPPELKDLLPYLPKDTVLNRVARANHTYNSINDWEYYPSSTGKSYDLSLRIGHDASLWYSFENNKATWSYDIGGGDAPKDILLSP